MLKYFLFIALAFTGCATTVTTEYGKGCRDGISAYSNLVKVYPGRSNNIEVLDTLCNDIEDNRTDRAGLPHGRSER